MKLLEFTKNMVNLRFRNMIKCFYYFYCDFKIYFPNCINGSSGKDQILAKIMLNIHQLEKGLSHTNTARPFGEEKAKNSILLINEYLAFYERNSNIELAINVLNKYLQNKYSTRNRMIREDIQNLIKENEDIIGKFDTGVKFISKHMPFDESLILDFFFSRNSVREFSHLQIDDSIIVKIMQFASCTPTACNRQTSRVHVYRDKIKMEKILENQLGNQGWCDNATAIFVLTSNISFFNSSYERQQAYIDGGLYAMNFSYGLHLNNIASCFKMYIREPNIDKEFHKIANIPDNEVPIVLILAGHYKAESTVSPMSLRLPIIENENLFFHS